MKANFNGAGRGGTDSRAVEGISVWGRMNGELEGGVGEMWVYHFDHSVESFVRRRFDIRDVEEDVAGCVGESDDGRRHL